MNGTSLIRRALLAVLLMAGFYAFALAMVAALLWVPYAELRYVHRVHFQLTAVCLGAAGTILWSLVPRRDRFEPPGPRLEPESQPKLFAVIDEVAAATGERSPDEVYLVNQVNAWVAERGGVVGFRSRRVMGVGLPLLQTLSLAEFRAVVAHEFGHYRRPPSLTAGPGRLLPARLVSRFRRPSD